jgi:hypothetical protein
MAAESAAGEAKYNNLEKRLAEGPVIAVPTITLEGDDNGAPHADGSAYASKFSGKYQHRIIKGGVGTICHRRLRRPSLRQLLQPLPDDQNHVPVAQGDCVSAWVFTRPSENWKHRSLATGSHARFA